jgi:hypothetical protein
MPASLKTPELSLTDFVDVVLKSGTPKATKVRQVKDRPDYHPAFDFYRPIREAIVDTHSTGGSRPQFRSLAGAVVDPKKQKNYPDVIAGYEKWWGTKAFTWFAPARSMYVSAGVSIIINPEVGLSWNDTPHLIKLYFKDEPLDKHRAALILDLMEYTLRPTAGEAEISVLDVRKSKLYSRTGGPLATIPLINAEMAYIASLWQSI